MPLQRLLDPVDGDVVECHVHVGKLLRGAVRSVRATVDRHQRPLEGGRVVAGHRSGRKQVTGARRLEVGSRGAPTSAEHRVDNRLIVLLPQMTTVLLGALLIGHDRRGDAQQGPFIAQVNCF